MCLFIIIQQLKTYADYSCMNHTLFIFDVIGEVYHMLC